MSTVNSSPVLSCRSLVKSFPAKDGRDRLQVLRGVDLELKSGQMIAITGSSGCGKSTLLHLLGGLDRP
ncbi:MAG: ATP-binding cassette domain-containing protein, partial [Bacteroidetes bacterium]|nr:ATP-binding cassette domain-containing protein [Bacteroidota bacterium]